MAQQAGAQHLGQGHVEVRGEPHAGVPHVGDARRLVLLLLLLLLLLLPLPLEEPREGKSAGAEAVVWCGVV